MKLCYQYLFFDITLLIEHLNIEIILKKFCSFELSYPVLLFSFILF